ncbi:hypothetical protein [Streptomyces nigrescens]|uniref:hypothetical protein n=1 Tax=Streptomyces nigrescens TaxID=1920 RepID=UPI00370202CF
MPGPAAARGRIWSENGSRPGACWVRIRRCARAFERSQDDAATDGTARQETLADLELEEAVKQETAARLPGDDVAGLLRELVRTVHAARHVVFDIDLDEVRLQDASAFLGPLLARAVLDLAAADAAAGVPLTERLRGWPRIAGADAHLHGRMLAAHLAAHPPAGNAGAGEGRWETAVDLVPRLLASRPSPESARPAPSVREAGQVLPAGAGRADGTAEPLASWLRVWAGPVPLRRTVALDKEDLVELAAEAGPRAAAAALAAAQDAGADGYTIVLHRLVDADPAAWTRDVPAVLVSLGRPSLARSTSPPPPATTPAPSPTARPGPPSAPWSCAAPSCRGPPLHRCPLRRTGAVRPADPRVAHGRRPRRRLAGDLPDVLAHLHDLAGPLTRPAPSASPGHPTPTRTRTPTGKRSRQGAC